MPTIPSVLADELSCNIFLRSNNLDIQKQLGINSSDPIETFAKLRDLKRMVELVEPFSNAMSEGDIKQCGEILDLNWNLKKNLSKFVSTHIHSIQTY